MQQPYECELFQNKHNSFLFRSMGYYCGSRTLKMVMLFLLIRIFYNNEYTYCQIYMVMLFSTAKSVISLIYVEIMQ